MKRIIGILLVIAMLLTLCAACGKKDEKAGTAESAALETKDEKTDTAEAAPIEEKEEKEDTAEAAPSEAKSEKTDTAKSAPSEAKSEKTDTAKNAPIEAKDTWIAGVWALEITEFKESSDPLTGTLARVLKGYFEGVEQIEFKNDGKGVIGEKEIDYLLEDKKLTLTWDSSQNFTFDTSGDENSLELSYQGLLKLKLKRL